MQDIPTPHDARAAPRRRRHTILIIEDNEDNRDVYQTYLEHVGYAVLTAMDAESGLALARQRQPDLVVMDVGLPGMDGYAATGLLRSDAATRAIPVIILTAHVHPEDRARALEAGCNRFLTKPLEPQLLAAEIRRLLVGDAPTGG